MQRLEINYDELETVTRKQAGGLDGFSIKHPKHGIILTVFCSDTALLNAVDNALYERFGGKKDDQ